MNVFQWIENELAPGICTTDVLIYDDMDSQSGYSLPIVYQDFNSDSQSHWRDRGSIHDFVHSTRGDGGRLLDFGPGDGWPSLPVASFAGEVVGLDSSKRRVETCTANARRLGLANTEFTWYEAGTPLPFADESFDGVMAASSVEQAPDPRFIIEEFYRILKPGGRLRLRYEGLARYRNGQERDFWIMSLGDRRCRMILFDRDIAGEKVMQYGLTLAVPGEQLLETLGPAPGFSDLAPEKLAAFRPTVLNARKAQTYHPSGKTWVEWLTGAGFEHVIPSHGGAAAGATTYDWFPEKERPRELEAVDAAIRPVVELVVELRCPVELDPPITAVK